MTKPLYWVGHARKDLQGMPEHVRDTFGFALWLAQQGKQHSQTKPLKGFGGAGGSGSCRGLSRQHMAGGLHYPVEKCSLCSACFSEKICFREGNAQTRN